MAEEDYVPERRTRQKPKPEQDVKIEVELLPRARSREREVAVERIEATTNTPVTRSGTRKRVMSRQSDEFEYETPSTSKMIDAEEDQGDEDSNYEPTVKKHTKLKEIETPPPPRRTTKTRSQEEVHGERIVDLVENESPKRGRLTKNEEAEFQPQHSIQSQKRTRKQTETSEEQFTKTRPSRSTKRTSEPLEQVLPTGSNSSQDEQPTSKRRTTKQSVDDDEFVPVIPVHKEKKHSNPEPVEDNVSVDMFIELTPPTPKTRGVVKNDFIPLDYESSVLVFAHPGITYDEYRHAYNSRSKRPRKANGIYWCPCGLLKKTSQSFASHTKACPVYRACLPQHFRTQDDAIFQIQEGCSFLKPLCSNGDTCHDDC